MKESVIEGDGIRLRLLSRSDLMLWRDDRGEAEKRFGHRIDAEEIEGSLLNAFNKKIENMGKDPGNELWYSYFAIIHDGVIIGTIGPKGRPENGAIEIGYGVSEKYRNKGIATEAVRIFCAHYFTLNIEKIIAETEDANAPSQRVLVKNGFQEMEVRGNLRIFHLQR